MEGICKSNYSIGSAFGWDYGGQIQINPSNISNGVTNATITTTEQLRLVHLIEATASGNSIGTVTLKNGTSASITRTHPNLALHAGTNGYGIFGRFSDGVIGGETYSFRLDFLRCFVNGAIGGDYVPVYRKSDNEIGLLDVVNNVFCTNDGSGAFTKGNDV